MTPIQLPFAELKTALTGLSKIIPRRSTLPVLGCIRIERTGNGHIELTATDLDHFGAFRMEERAEGEPRQILVPYEDLNHVVKGCGRDDTLLLSSFGKDKAVIKFPVAGNTVEHQCESFPVDDFPPLPEVTGEPVSIESSLREAMQQGFQCASTDETRQILNGIYLDVSKPEGHYVVATDGRHLFSSNSFSLGIPESLVIPTHRFLDWKEFNQGDWALSLAKAEKDSAQRFELSHGGWRFITRAYEGMFPNWRQVAPDLGSYKTTLEVNPDSVQELIKTIAKLPEHDAVNHKVGLESAGTVSLLAGSGGDKWTPIALPEVKTTGKDVRVFLNRSYLVKALRFGLTRIDIADPLSPVRFSAGGRQMIVMPIRHETVKPAAPAPPPAAQPKEGPMPESNGKAEEKPALESALAQIEKIKTSYREAVGGLNDLTGLLRQAQREHKSNDKEVACVRQTLRSLQSVRI